MTLAPNDCPAEKCFSVGVCVLFSEDTGVLYSEILFKDEACGVLRIPYYGQIPYKKHKTYD